MTLTQILQKIRNAFYTKKEIDSMGGGSSLSDTISQKANDSNVVHKSGNENISGTKTFTEELCIKANNFDPTEASDTEGWFSNALRFRGNKGGLIGTLQGYKLPNKNSMRLFVRNKDSTYDGMFKFDDDGTFYARSIIGGPNNIDCSVDSQGDGYIRYSNGLQICTGGVYVGNTGGAPRGFAFTFEMSFAIAPVVTMGHNGNQSGDFRGGFENVVQTHCSGFVYTTADTTIHIIAIGRWK